MTEHFILELVLGIALMAMGWAIGYPMGWLACSRFRDKLERGGRAEVAQQLKELNANLKTAYDQRMREWEEKNGGKQ